MYELEINGVDALTNEFMDIVLLRASPTLVDNAEFIWETIERIIDNFELKPILSRK